MVVVLSHEESGWVGREINCDDQVDIFVREDLFGRLCVPYKHIAVVCPRCDPSGFFHGSRSICR